MDSRFDAAARALARGDALGVLKRTALHDAPSALALRGIATARLGDLVRARELLQHALRGFGQRDRLARARCVLAIEDISLAMRELERPPQALAAAIAVLDAHGDQANALHGRVIVVRRLVLLGRLAEAHGALKQLDGRMLPAALAALASLAAAELALRAIRAGPAREALERAASAADHAGLAPLIAEVQALRAALARPAARLLTAGGERVLRLAEVEALSAGDLLLVDACRLRVRVADAWVPLQTRPVLFALMRGLATAWPGDASRDALIATAFRLRRIDDTHRARLRVEIGRLRTLLAPWADVDATAGGYVLHPHEERRVAVILPPVEHPHASLLALLADGEAWSTPALALALGISQRSVQRALSVLLEAGQVRALGRTRNRRWLALPASGFATPLLLPVAWEDR